MHWLDSSFLPNLNSHRLYSGTYILVIIRESEDSNVWDRDSVYAPVPNQILFCAAGEPPGYTDKLKGILQVLIP